MADYFCISATFLDKRYHGRGDGGEPEWPPSPLRLMQAILAANAPQDGSLRQLESALTWLENQSAPLIVAPTFVEGSPYCLSVPNNAMDLVGKAWARGNYFGTGDSSPATHRTMKTVRPIHILAGDTVHYLWALEKSVPSGTVDMLAQAAKRVFALGWGIDLVVANAARVSSPGLAEISGERWQPANSATPVALRTPSPGTLRALKERHEMFENRIGDKGFVPVPPLTQFDVVGYRRPTDPVTRPHAVFELRHDDDSFCRYSQRKLIHIAGMMRHLATREMEKSPPSGVDDNWVERYVAGHRDTNAEGHKQFSYIPLPSIGHYHADQLVRRMMIAAPIGDDGWLNHLVQRLAGLQLIPQEGNEFGEEGPPALVRVYRDKVARCYTNAANKWASVTPVVLPGHDDKRPAKTRKLIEKALAISGIEQPCEFEWSTLSRFRKSVSAHKYNRNKRANYYLPPYLQSRTAVHLTLTFNDELRVPGPLIIGAGRHCGFGLMAGIDK